MQELQERNRKFQRPKQRRIIREKICRLCVDKKQNEINFKNTTLLSYYVTPEKGKILPSRITGNCRRCQKRIAKAIKQARNMALMR